jgi:hypothetical protein
MNSINDLSSSNLGDLTGALPEHENVVDFSWLSPTSGDTKDNYPSDSPKEIIPQLENSWSRDITTSPNARIDQKALKSSPAKDKSPEDKVEVERVAKKAMMLGLSGKDMILHLRERFSSEQIDAASEELRKVAAEDGLLGNVYLDLSAFNTTKEALSTLGHHRIRLASLAIGAPIRERNFVDPSGKCLHLAKVVVDKVEYTGGLIAHYASHLKNIGAIPQDAIIESKEMLRNAFVQSRFRKVAEIKVDTGTEATGLSDKNKKILDDGELNKLNEYSASQQAQVRMARVRPILAKIQDMMLAGAQDEDLKEGIRACCDSHTIEEFSPEISNMVSRQGLIGPVLADASLYGDVPSAVSAIGKAPSKPLFIISTMPVPAGFMGGVSGRTGIPVMNGPEDLTHEHAAKVVTKMNGAGQLDNETAHELIKMASERQDKPMNLIRLASKAKGLKTDKATKIETKKSEAAPSSFAPQFKADKAGEKAEARKKLQDKAKEALGKGVKASALQTKLASYVPIGEAIGIMREALAAMDEVNADALDECQSSKYSLKKTASLKMASKCSACVFQSCGTCSKQGRNFRTAAVKTASARPYSNPVAEMGLSNRMMDLDLSGVVTPARRPIGLDVTLPNASFGDMTF